MCVCVTALKIIERFRLEGTLKGPESNIMFKVGLTAKAA